MSSFHIKILDHLPSEPSFISQWNGLFEETGQKEPFNSYEWVKACTQSLGTRRVFILAGYVHDRLAALACLSIHKGVIEWLTSPWADYCDFLCKPSDYPEFLEACCDCFNTHQWGRIRLSHIPENALISGMLKDLRIGKSYANYTWAYKNVGPALDFTKASKDELETILNKKGVERKINKLSLEGPLEYRLIEDAATSNVLMEKFCAWQVKRFSSLDSLHKVLRHLCEGPMSSIKFCMPTLWYKDEPIAMYIAFKHGYQVTLYSTTFDERVKSSSPGEILTYLMVRSFYEQGVDKIDFCLGRQPYKLRFSNVSRQSYALTLYRHSWQLMAVKACSSIVSVIKKSPRFYKTLKSISEGFSYEKLLQKYLA